MNDFRIVLIGDTMSAGSFLGFLVIAIVTALVVLGYHGNKKRKTSAKSPVRFSLTYLIADNWKRIGISLAVMALSIRFSKELLNADMTPWGAVIIGGSVNFLAGLIQKTFKK